METIFREVKTKLRISENENVNFAPHVHDDAEVIYVRRGCGNAWCDGKRYALSQGDVFVAFPNQIHSYSDFVDGAYIVLIIKPVRLLYVESIFRDALPQGSACAGTGNLEQLLREALAEYRQHGDSYVIDGYLTAFFGKLFQMLPLEKRSVLSDKVPLILQYCNSHYKEAICIQDLCDQLLVSRSYVSHMFSNHLKICFPDYINGLRLNEAVSLLEGSVLNMTQVAEQAGFSTIRTFNRVFRKQFGYAPSEYRKRRTGTD